MSEFVIVALVVALIIVIGVVIAYFRRKDVPTPAVIKDVEDKVRAKYESYRDKP